MVKNYTNLSIILLLLLFFFLKVLVALFEVKDMNTSSTTASDSD